MTEEQRDALIFATAQAVRSIIENSLGCPPGTGTYSPARCLEAYKDLESAINAVDVVVAEYES